MRAADWMWVAWGTAAFSFTLMGLIALRGSRRRKELLRERPRRTSTWVRPTDWERPIRWEPEPWESAETEIKPAPSPTALPVPVVVTPQPRPAGWVIDKQVAKAAIVGARLQDDVTDELGTWEPWTHTQLPPALARQLLTDGPKWETLHPEDIGEDI